MPRPSKNLTRRVTVRLTPEEYNRLQLGAHTAAVELSTLARAQLTDGAIPRRARRVSVDHTEIARLRVDLGKIGGNLNQAVKLAHTYGDLLALRNANAMIAELAAIRQLAVSALDP